MDEDSFNSWINNSRRLPKKLSPYYRYVKQLLESTPYLSSAQVEDRLKEAFKELPNVVVTPHTASATRSSRGGMARIAAENLLAMVEGQKAPHCVNPEVYT